MKITEKKEKIKFISPLIISFFLGIFILKYKKKQYKKGNNVFFLKKGGG